MTAGEPCPVCGTPRRAQAVFCHNCGASLAESHSPPAAAASVEPPPARAEAGPVAATLAPTRPAAPMTPSPMTADYAVCPNCGTGWVEGAHFCFDCGYRAGHPIGGDASAPTGVPLGVATIVPAGVGVETSAATEPPNGKARNLFAFVGLMLVTIHIYLYVWIYRTYKEVTAHSPGVTQITPGRALGFLFIPLFNVIWAFRLFADIPRSVAELQSRHPLGEPVVNKALATGLVIAGWVLLVVGGYSLDWRVLIVGEPLFLAGFLLVQHALNQHWARRPVRASEVAVAR